MFVSCEKGREFDFSNFTLILPAVSIGNVGQLAIDVLIFNLPCEKIGHLYDSSILPLVGNDPFTKPGEDYGNLVTSAEVFKCNEKDFVIVQQRAPVAKGCRQIYCQSITQWIKKCQFKKTILLTSCLASERIDSQIQSAPFRFMLNSAAQHLKEIFEENFGWKMLEERKQTTHNEESDECKLFLPGGGVTKCLYETCCQEKISLVILLAFCAEGDNIPDAMSLLYFANSWLHLLPDSEGNSVKEQQTCTVAWSQPPSWQNLYGAARFSSIF